MKKNKNGSPLSRRTFLGFSISLPFLASTMAAKGVDEAPEEDQAFVTMLNAEGKAVRVRKDALKSAKIINPKMSNKALLNWLKPKRFDSNP